ncbi:hypothetical protein KPL70_026612 [Citrus sinensis]|nr:hypothetical protein KPL70_026612 [Citrus sinensis]
MDGNAITDLHLTLADGVLSSVEEKKTTKEIWNTLTKLYEAKSLHNKIFSKRKLYSFRMAESTTVTDHINTLKTLFSQLTTLGHKIEENECAELILQSLPDSYDPLIINLTNNNPADSLVFDDVAASILNEESRRENKEDRRASSQQVDVLSVTRGRSTERGSSGSHNHGRSKFRSKKNVKCYNCGKKECWNNQKRRGGKEPESSNAQGHITSTSDNGATWPITSRREWFHTYEPILGRYVYISDGHALEIVGIDIIKIKIFDGTIRTIGEVRHVNGLKKNLLSLGQIDSHGCKTHVENGIMKITRGALVLMKVERIGANLFILKRETLQEVDACVASNIEESTIMWHLKLSYMSEQDMSMGGAKYLVTFIDDYSRRCWAYPIKKKLDVFPVFKQYKAWVKLQFGKMIKCLRTDNDEEYTNGAFLAFYKQEAKNVCYVINRSPSTTIELKTPMEMWTEKPIDYSHIHAFGCPVYVMYNAQERAKLDPKFRRCIFLEYVDGVKGYRLVVKRYAQKEGIDFNEIFSPVVRLRTIRIVLAMCATFDLYQLDMKITFLHRELEEEIYMLQLEGFVENGKENLVYRLSLDHCGYYKKFEDNDFIILLLYVDNMLVAGPNEDRVQELKAQLASWSSQSIHGEFWWRALDSCEGIMRYIKGTSDVALCYGGSEFTVRGYVIQIYRYTPSPLIHGESWWRALDSCEEYSEIH